MTTATASSSGVLARGRASVSPDEYVFAALNLYLDVLNVFLYQLRLLQALQSDQ